MSLDQEDINPTALRRHRGGWLLGSAWRVLAVCLAALVTTVLLGTLLALIAHQVATWTGLSATSLTVGMVGVAGIMTLLFAGMSLSSDVQAGMLVSTLEDLAEHPPGVDSAATEELPATRPRRQRPRRDR